MSALEPEEVERWLLRLGALLPREAVLVLTNEVRRKAMDGEAFDALVASRTMPSLGDALRPAHMATLRRCWASDYRGPRAGGGDRSPSAATLLSSPAPPPQQRFAPPARPAPRLELPQRAAEGRPAEAARPARPAAPAPPLPPPDSPFNGDMEAPDSPAPLAVGPPPQAIRPPQVPKLDLRYIHRNAGNRGEAEVLNSHQWKKPGRPAVLNGPGIDVRGFSSASAEDQQRIAEFYGYRDEGFAATMHELRTDKIRPRLYLGNMGDAAYWPLLEELGVTHVLNCAVEAQKAPPPYESRLKYMLLPLQDNPDQTQVLLRQRFKPVRDGAKFIHTSLKANPGGCVFVHCVQGLARSAAVVCAYLMEYEGLALDRAMAEVKQKHRGCLATQHWQVMLQKLDAELLRGR